MIVLKASFDDTQPIFQQIANMTEDHILSGTYRENEQVMSTTQIAKTFQINPATAVKGINLLVNEGILYKKRGVGMFVASGAKEKILTKRRKMFYQEYVVKLLEEAKKIQLSAEDIVNMINNDREGD